MEPLKRLSYCPHRPDELSGPPGGFQPNQNATPEEIAMTTATQKKIQNRKNRGQGMTEYIIIVALIAIAAIGVITLFGDNVRAIFGASTEALNGTANVTVNTTSKATTYSSKNIKNFSGNNY
jgi:Flp pilus assembly pilin Flp